MPSRSSTLAEAAEQSLRRRRTTGAAALASLSLLALSRIALGGVLGAELSVLAAAATGPLGSVALTLGLILPLHLGLSALLELIGSLPGTRWIVATGARILPVSVWPGSVTALTVLIAAEYGANRFLTDTPFGAKTAMAYGLGMTVALLSALLIHRLVRRPSVRDRLERHPSLAPAAAFCGLGFLAFATAAWGVPPGYPALERAALFSGVFCFAAGVTILLRATRRVGLLSLGALVVGVLLLLPGWLRNQVEPSAVSAARTRRGLSWQLVEAGRRATDRDRDGFSASLAGGDCDDADPGARPLSRKGRDCLGWVPLAPAQPPALVPSAVVGKGPPVVVLVTIDAFRCGLGRHDRPELRDICPNLTRLASEGAARLDVRTPPITSLAMAALHLGGEEAPRTSLGELVGRAGYRTHAITTHHHLLQNERIRSSFATVDESLAPRSELPNAATADEVTDRALDWLRGADQRPERAFLWVHYYDPHAPYVSHPGAMFVFDHMRAYAAEVRRADAEVARLAAGLKALSRAADVLLLVMADHGEELDEAGHERHGTSLREAAVRVPLIAWSPGAWARTLTSEVLPGSPHEMRPFVASLLGGPPFKPSDEVILYTRPPSDPQVAIVRDGWKLIHHVHLAYSELFHLPTDPFETDDRSHVRADLVGQLGRRLGVHSLSNEALQETIARNR